MSKNTTKKKHSRSNHYKKRREVAEFTEVEFETRVERARKFMTRERLDAMLLTSEANLEYMSGFSTQFAWNTPSRPWYFIMPRIGRCTAVIPEIGETNWRLTSWVQNVFTWPSPRPQNEGLDLLQTVIEKIKRRYGRIGVEMGPESRLGMPMADVLRLQQVIRPLEMADCIGVMRELRLIKSKAEIARIRHICQIASDTFDALPGFTAAGDTEKDLVRKFQSDILMRGADKTPYTAIGSGLGGYESIIMGPTSRRLRKGDIFLIDTGSRYEGYFCDFDRNYAIGAPTNEVKRIHDLLYRATRAGINAARPGYTAADVFHAQAKVLTDSGIELGNVGRFGHGLGKILTEPPSNKPDDRTKLVPDMVLTIEPSAMYGDRKILVHEENLVITEDKPKLLSRRAPREMVVIEC
ncbi:MAG: Xaa-Pro peptidase family protein [Gammaproteobacteria bacterium]|nr:Xaa-Pro peptidase family protein [Gammaproteobacteria bacterium]